MKRLKYFFSAILLALSVPAWRLLDWAVVTLPFPTFHLLQQLVWFGLFILLPLSTFVPRLKFWIGLVVLACYGSLVWLTGSLSGQATLEPTRTQCGRLTYAGAMYPIRGILTNAYQDDLEAKNQLCWMVKLIRNVPENIPADELASHLNIMKNKMMKPEHKFKVALPWITILLGRYLNSSKLENAPLLIQNLGFWADLYSEEISSRKYEWYDWPLSSMIQLEYGFIERNWENIQIEIRK